MLSKALSTHAAGAGCNEIGFKPVFFTIPWLDMLVSVTGAGEINPDPAEVRSQQHFNSFSCKSHAFAHVRGQTREGRGVSTHCAPRGGWLQCEPASPCTELCSWGLQCSWPYPHPLPKPTRHVSAWLGGLKSSLWPFN